MAAAERSLIVLQAPSGCGKTMALLSYQQRYNRSCYWASGPELTLSLNGKIALCDDMQLENLPRMYDGSNVVVATSEPLTPWLKGELKAGRAALFSTGDLLFDEFETASLFSQAQPSREVRLLHHMVNGWPLGVALLARLGEPALTLVRRSGRDHALPQSLSDCFEDDILGSMTPELCCLLMDLSIFGYFSRDLITALPRQASAAVHDPQMIECLVRDGLFLYQHRNQLSPITMMPALARHLRQRLQHQSKSRYEQLQDFAVRWNTIHDKPAEVLRHGLAVWHGQEALDKANAAGAIVMSLAQGPDLDVAAPLVAASVLTTPLTFFGLIYERIRRGAFSEARLHYEAAYRLSNGFTHFAAPQQMDEIRAWVMIFEAVMLIADDEGYDETWYQDFMATFHHTVSTHPLSAMAMGTIATILPLEMGCRQVALNTAHFVLKLHQNAQADRASFFVHLHRSAALMASGQLSQANEAISAAYELALQTNHADSYEMVIWQIHAGVLAFEMGEFDKAYALLAPCEELLPRVHGWRSLWCDFYSALAEISFIDGDLLRTEQILKRAREMALSRESAQLRFAMDLLEINFLVRRNAIDLAKSKVDSLEVPVHLSVSIKAQMDITTARYRRAVGLGGFHLSPKHYAECDLRHAFEAYCDEVALHTISQNLPMIFDGLRAAVPLMEAYPRLAQRVDLNSAILAGYECLRKHGYAVDDIISTYFRDIILTTPVRLSKREKEIMSLIMDGLSTKEIARIIGISEGTIKSHRKNIYKKMDVNSRSMAIKAAKELRLR